MTEIRRRYMFGEWEPKPVPSVKETRKVVAASIFATAVGLILFGALVTRNLPLGIACIPFGPLIVLLTGKVTNSVRAKRHDYPSEFGSN